MRSTFRSPVPNMKGKKTYTFGCRCCDAFDLREQYQRKLAEEEMREAKHHDPVLR